MMSDDELKDALAELRSVKKALRQRELNDAWKHLSKLELMLGRSLRQPEHAHQDV